MATEKIRPFVYVGLGYNNQRENINFARRLVEGIDSQRFGLKINLFSAADFNPGSLSAYEFTKEIQSLEKPVFIDMKMRNGGGTMAHVAEGCANLGVDIINAYIDTGPKFMGRLRDIVEGTETKLFGLTVLTHYTDEDTLRLYGKNLRDSVRMLAEGGVEYGVHGIILPGTQLEAVRDLDILKLSGGIRPNWYGDQRINDQEQIVTPKEACVGGANYIAIDSPIRKSLNQVGSLRKIIDEIEQASLTQ